MKINDIFMYILGALLVLGFFVVLLGLLFFKIPEGNENALYLALGTLFGSFSGVVTYFYGSSAGSKHKTELLANQQMNKQDEL
jgi:uncharacterized membrane protein YdjX (TVP38/TMEM64 family)